MNKIRHIILCFGLCVAVVVHGQDVKVAEVLEDIFTQLSEDGDLPYEDIEEELLSIAENPMDLNQVTGEDLSRLMFLNDEQIDAILMYQYQYGYRSVYELQLIDCLKDYDIRNLLPFVEVKGEESRKLNVESRKLYFREVFHYARHEITLRTDARNIEDYEGDPIYGKLRYRFNYQNRVQAGVTVMRELSDRAIQSEGERWHYGGYVQLKDIGPMKTIVAGNYQANFGYGLVVGSPFKRGKSAYVKSTAITDEGLKKYTSVGEGYNYFHGLGATARIKWADVSAFYSLRDDKDEWQHVVGANFTARWKRLKVGVTGIESLKSNVESQKLSDKGAMGVNVRYNWGKVDLWGEVAASQGEKWGWGSIVGVRYTPISDWSWMAIYRYYSPDYENVYANTLCNHTRVQYENGGYLGVSYNGLRNWQFSAFGDVWQDGYESIVESAYLPSDEWNLRMRARAKNKNELGTYSLRFRYEHNHLGWKFRTQLDGNLVRQLDAQSGLSYGWSLFQDVEYRFRKVPIVLQFRAQAFDAKEWNNRVYMYEYDVLYAYSIPFVYGMGGRFWLNARYAINDRLGLYLRWSETVYEKRWALAHNRKTTRSDIHLLLRVKI